MNDDYRDFLGYLFDAYVRSRRSHHRFYDRRLGPGSMDYHFERMRRAAELSRFIVSFSDDDDVYRTFQPEPVREAISDVSDGLSLNNKLLDEFGFMDVLDVHYNEIVEGLNAEQFPEEDLWVLKSLGSPDPQRDLRAIVLMLKLRREGDWPEQTLIKSRLSSVQERLMSEVKSFPDRAEPRKEERTSRRWFKGLGQIAQGAALSIANVGLAMGTLNLPVSPETQTWGSLLSVTTGVGLIFIGAGDLRGE